MGLRHSDSDCHYWRPDLGFPSAGAISFPYGKSRRLQSSQAARGWIDNRRSGSRRRNCWCDFRLAQRRHSGLRATTSSFVLVPIVVVALALWPVLGTSYRGLPIDTARLITLIGLALCFFTFERTLLAAFHFLTRARRASEDREFSPAIGRRALVLGGIGLLVAGGGAAVLRKLYHAAAFSYDGLQYKGRIVQSITPNDQFYCVTKNVVDPRVNVHLWHLEINGLVQNPRVYRFEDLKDITSVEQETTLMCISNGLDAGLISNAVWNGLAIHDLLGPAVPLSHAARVRFWGVDNYTDTIPLEKAMEPTTLLAYEMNGVPLPHRHGYPGRVIVPGYFGEKHVKWLTRIEVTDANAKGFYETQGWARTLSCQRVRASTCPITNHGFRLAK